MFTTRVAGTPFEQCSGAAGARASRSSANVIADYNCQIFANKSSPAVVDGYGFARLIRRLIFRRQQMAATSESGSIAAAPLKVSDEYGQGTVAI